MSNDTGGPAFPTKNYAAIQPIAEGYSEGMTLRDYFAAKAMPWVASDLPASEDFFIRVAEFSYAMADAMLKVRSIK